jgi:site-specific recombinase XerD
VAVFDGGGEGRLHNCRHAFASMLVNEAASLNQVQLLRGDASSVSTQRYANRTANTLRNTAQLISSLVNKS